MGKIWDAYFWHFFKMFQKNCLVSLKNSIRLKWLINVIGYKPVWEGIVYVAVDQEVHVEQDGQ